jgi:penicillin-binding protein 1B
VRQGGSTITQQTVKNLFLSPERSWWRKIREGAMALIVDARYPKPRILEVYLNEVYLGQRGSVAICGVQAASRFYFGRDVHGLSLAESAMLAGLIQSPGRHNPFLHPQEARQRRDSVLQSMRRLGLATESEIEAAQAEPLRLASGRAGYREAGHAVDFVRAQLAAHFAERILQEEGLRIYTTLDTLWQEAVERALITGIERLERTVPTVKRQLGRRRLQGAVIVTDPGEGAVLALLGGRDYAESQFNRATHAARQPGSCFKPIVYAAGLEIAERGDASGLTAATLLDDSPFEVVEAGKRWAPSNYDRAFRGEVSVRQAIEESLNVPAVRAARQVGLSQVVEMARRCGITSEMAAVPSLALGTSEVTPLELAGAFGTFASGGRHVAPWIVREVQDGQGKIVGRRRVNETRALSPHTAFLVNDLLRGVLQRGTASSASGLGYRGHGAGKTGTTDNTRDAWFVGYTPRRLALVWVGFDDNVSTGLTGAAGALPIWVEAMKAADDPEDGADFAPPSGMVRVEIDPTTGQAAASCPERVTEWFAPGTEPVETCRLHGPGRLRRWFDRIFRRERPPRGPAI